MISVETDVDMEENILVGAEFDRITDELTVVLIYPDEDIGDLFYYPGPDYSIDLPRGIRIISWERFHRLKRAEQARRRHPRFYAMRDRLLRRITILRLWLGASTGRVKHIDENRKDRNNTRSSSPVGQAKASETALVHKRFDRTLWRWLEKLLKKYASTYVDRHFYKVIRGDWPEVNEYYIAELLDGRLHERAPPKLHVRREIIPESLDYFLSREFPGERYIPADQLFFTAEDDNIQLQIDKKNKKPLASEQATAVLTWARVSDAQEIYQNHWDAWIHDENEQRMAAVEKIREAILSHPTGFLVTRIIDRRTGRVFIGSAVWNFIEQFTYC